MSEEDYYKNLPKKYIAAGALIFDTQGRVLLVKPVYKDTWEIPGGVVEMEESPNAACQREIKEELGLELQISQLLCVDYVRKRGFKGDTIQIIFSGGILTEAQIAGIKLQTEELSEYKFVDLENINLKFTDKLRFRIENSIKASRENKTVYSENPYY